MLAPHALPSQETVPGSFFAKYPRWRQLISINKRAAGA